MRRLFVLTTFACLLCLSSLALAQDAAPVVTAPATKVACENALLTFTVGAVDPDGDAIAALTASGTAITAGAAFTAGAGNTSGTFAWTPTFTSAGSYAATFTAQNALSGSAMTAILVGNSCDRAPVVTAPATVSGTEGSLITFTVGATDLDGDAITVFTASGTAISAGATFAVNASNTSGTLSWVPSLTQAGTYSATFFAANTLSGTGTTNISVAEQSVPPFTARAFTSTSYRTIRLNSGKAFWCASVEPIGGSFDVSNIAPTSVVLMSPGTGSVAQISAYVGKSVVVGDADKNDVADMTFCFRKEDLRLLFSNVNGKATLNVALAGSLTSGGGFNAPLSIDVIGSGGNLAASVTPNPLNPSGVLSFVSTRTGAASIRIFDSTGRLVRVLEEGTLSQGRHDLRIDGRDESGGPLATGIYFYRVKLAEGTATGRFAILK